MATIDHVVAVRALLAFRVRFIVAGMYLTVTAPAVKRRPLLTRSVKRRARRGGTTPIVGGTVQPARHADRNRRVRGRLTSDGDRWVFMLNPRWIGETGVEFGDEVVVDLEPEGPLREDLAVDIATSLAANPVAAAFFDTLAQFYRKAYLRYIDATVRRPEVRAQRIAEVVELLAVGVKQRPRHQAIDPSA